jgi:quercetin dioxygenase-like cupin family protein
MAALGRRIVTGLDEEGRSTVIIDAPMDSVVAWSTIGFPVDNSGAQDRGGAFSFKMPRDGTKFLMVEFQPTGELTEGGMHATNTIDYLVVVKGEVVLITETGETICRAGDLVIDRGIVHGWRVDAPEPCVVALVMIDALPVGAGKNVG